MFVQDVFVHSKMEREEVASSNFERQSLRYEELPGKLCLSDSKIVAKGEHLNSFRFSNSESKPRWAARF